MKIANGMEFVNDDRVIGKWENIGWTSSTDSLSVTDLNAKSGEYNILFFLPNGEPYWIFEGWTKGVILIHYGGDEPILTYRYDFRDIGGRQYLFFRLDDKTEVFVKADSERYTKETLGIHDNIDLPFVSDEALIGEWDSVAFVSEIGDFSPDKKDCQHAYATTSPQPSDGCRPIAVPCESSPTAGDRTCNVVSPTA